VSRYKQTCTCKRCGHSAWRELIVDAPFEPVPDPTELGRRARCTKCGAKDCDVAQEMLTPKWADAFRPGGHTPMLIGFAESAARDASIAAATAELQKRKNTPPG
jgi:hypothetical protein